MRVIAFVTQKGGSGKTTLCLNLAIAAERRGGRVLIVDMDPQGTAEAWYQDREAPRPKLARLDAQGLIAAKAEARGRGYSHLFVDTPGRDEPAVAAAIRASDFCVVPCRPTPADMKATPATIATIKRLDRPAAFVLNQTPPRGFRIKEAMNGLAVLGPVSPHGVVARAVYQDAQGAGAGVLEWEQDGKAAQEIEELWSWLERKMEKLSYDESAA